MLEMIRPRLPSRTSMLALVAFCLASFSMPIRAAAEEPGAVEEILAILADRGLIDESTHSELLRRHRHEQDAERGSASSSLLDGIDWSADLRLRYESFHYDGDSLGNDRDNRYRFRYRVRFGITKKVNDWVSIGLRLASGTDDPRSSNQTLGEDEDFDPDAIFIDRAYAQIRLPERGRFAGEILAGKIPNPFLWKHGKDFVVWDGDVNPEGMALATSMQWSESSRLFAKAGGFVVDENDLSADPKVFALQMGGETELADGLGLGLRASGYEWRSLDVDFVTRAMAEGNLASGFDGRARIGELSAFLTLERSADWPVELYATTVRNFSADDAVLSGFPVGAEDTAWGVGLEIGNAKRFVKLGAGYFHVEANAVVAPFTDSDLFDGKTNRRGWIFYASRSLLPGVALNLTFSDSDSIKNTGGAAGPFATSSADADRKRLQTDLAVSF